MKQALVIIPGMDGAGVLFEPAIDELKSRGWRILKIEHCEESEWLSPTGSVERLTDRVADVMDRESISQAVICGESFGSMAALDFARGYPERTTGLIICGGFGWLPFPTRRKLLAALYPILAIGASLIPTFLLLWGARVWNPLVRRSEPLHLRRASRQIAVPSARCILAKIRLALNFDARPWLAEIVAPTIVLSGTRDPVIPIQCAERLAASIPGACLLRIPDGGHLAHHAQPQLFVNACEKVTSLKRSNNCP